MIISGKALLAGVLGWPVSHSLSPRLHGFWLERYGIDGAYLPLPLRPEAFATAVRSLGDLGFRGANVTIPHKEAAFDLCDERSDRAAKMGAVNTLVFEDGKIIGDNTDGFGFLENLKAAQPGWTPAIGRAVILGAGGAARGLTVALLDAGCAEIVLINRTQSRAEALVEELSKLGYEGRVLCGDWASLPLWLPSAELLVNSTSLGMTGQPPLEIDLGGLPTDALVTDIVYAPLKTDLLKKADALGLRRVEGLGMLLHQARPGFERWFGQAPEVDQDLRDFVLQGL